MSLILSPQGLKATSITVSAVVDMGYLVENVGAYESRSSMKKMQIKKSEIHHIFLAAITGTIKDKQVPAQLTTGVFIGEVIRSLALIISPEDIHVEQPLHAYGVDSLTAVEVRNWVMKELKSDISNLDILSSLPIHGLSTKIAEGSKILPAKLRVEISNS